MEIYSNIAFEIFYPFSAIINIYGNLYKNQAL